MADLDADRLPGSVETVAAAGPGTTEAALLDVADRDAVHGLVSRVHAEHGRLDVLCNNAGLPIGGEPEELTPAHWDRAIDVNLKGVLHGCEAAYPLMVGQGGGHIVNTSSLAGLIPAGSLLAPYGASKHGVVGLSLAYHLAGARHGVGVHVVCPGGVDTPILDRVDVEGLPTPPSMLGNSARQMAAAVGVRRFYDPDRLAEDVLDGAARGRPVIVAPASARAMWWAWRLAPGLMVRGILASQRRLDHRIA